MLKKRKGPQPDFWFVTNYDGFVSGKSRRKESRKLMTRMKCFHMQTLFFYIILYFTYRIIPYRFNMYRILQVFYLYDKAISTASRDRFILSAHIHPFYLYFGVIQLFYSFIWHFFFIWTLSSFLFRIFPFSPYSFFLYSFKFDGYPHLPHHNWDPFNYWATCSSSRTRR